MLCREVNTPASLMYRSPLQEGPADIETYVRDLEDKILTGHETARRRLHTSEER